MQQLPQQHMHLHNMLPKKRHPSINQVAPLCHQKEIPLICTRVKQDNPIANVKGSLSTSTVRSICMPVAAASWFCRLSPSTYLRIIIIIIIIITQHVTIVQYLNTV
jgi:hypothetical protein